MSEMFINLCGINTDIKKNRQKKQLFITAFFVLN